MAAVAASSIFASVFPPPSDVPVPTPTNTPQLPSSSTFGDPLPQRPPSSHDNPVSGVAEQIRWDRSWHTATTSLSLSNGSINIDTTKGEEELKKQWWGRVPDTETRRAIEYLLDKGKKLRQDEDLMRWSFEVQIVWHFQTLMRPVIKGILEAQHHDDEVDKAVQNLLRVGKGLYLCQAVYLHPVKRYMERFLPTRQVQRLERDVHSLFVHCLPKDNFENGLKRFFLHQASLVLDVDRDRFAPGYAHQTTLSRDLMENEMEKTLSWLKALQGVGLGGRQAQRIFGEAMDEILTAYVKTRFSRQWNASPRSESLRAFIHSVFMGFNGQILRCLQDSSTSALSLSAGTSQPDLQKWQEIAIRRLGVLRVDELLDLVLELDCKFHGSI